MGWIYFFAFFGNLGLFFKFCNLFKGTDLIIYLILTIINIILSGNELIKIIEKTK